ncbi:hypothetical protein Gpo141_00008531 [Globisporangium polare]
MATALSMTASSSSSTGTSKAQRTTTAAALSSTATSSKNWRGKYLRALNISTPEVDVVSRKKHPPASVHTSDLRSQQQVAQQARRSRTNLTASDNNSKSVSFSRSFSTSTDRDGDEFQAARVNRYQVPQTARYSHRRALHATGEQLTTGSTSKNSYGFALKPDLARGRRCHTDPFVASTDRVASESESRMVMASAPIQIPTSAGAGDIFSIGGKLSDLTDGGGPTMANKNYKSKRYGSKSPAKNNCSNNHNRSSNKLVNNSSNQDAVVGNLLSWEEPAVMMIGVKIAANDNKTKPGGSALGGLDMAFSSLRLDGDLGGVNNSIRIGGDDGELFCDEFVETEDDDDDGSDEDEDVDEIFEMEDFDSDASNINNNNNHGGSSSVISKSKARRRRTASASQATTASSPSKRSSAALPRYHSVRQMRSHGTPTDLTDSATAMELPESFVPPHQLIQRDCFSIGLRDEFKRRQPKI